MDNLTGGKSCGWVYKAICQPHIFRNQIYTDLCRQVATYASRSGIPIEIASKVILRHSNLSTTQRYPRKSSELKDEPPTRPGKTIFPQRVDFLSPYEFHQRVQRYNGYFKFKSFSCWDQFLCMVFAQVTCRESLRGIQACLRVPRIDKSLQFQNAAVLPVAVNNSGIGQAICV